MGDFNTLDPILRGRTADPAVREGITLVEYPEYLIAGALEGEGLQQVHNRMGAENLTPEAAATIITEMIVESLADIQPQDSAGSPPSERGKTSFIPGLSARFPKPVISRLFGKKGTALDSTEGDLVFHDDSAPINFNSPMSSAVLMRAEAVTQLWRRGKVEPEEAIRRLTTLMEEYRTSRQGK